jgi:holo-[acyl-carrier protein] synthase
VSLRVGIDLVSVATIEESLAGKHRDHYLESVYTRREVDDCRGADGAVEAEGLAARFAAKEAAIKALPGAGEGVRLTQVEVVTDALGQPSLELSGRAADSFAEAGGTEIAVSLTHEAGFAAATVVIV